MHYVFVIFLWVHTFIGNKCYTAKGRKESERLTWTRALALCRAYGADLVSIQSQEEQGNYMNLEISCL